MSNSSLVSFKQISPHRTAPRNAKIDTITIHCYVGHASLQSMGGWFANASAKASSNYGVDDNGNVGMFVEEKDRSWCTSSSANDNRAVTIEMACDKTSPYAVTDKALAGVIKLCVDICKRNGIDALRWQNNSALIGQPAKQNMTVHRWFANKACPGDYLMGKMSYIAQQVNAQLQNGSSNTGNSNSGSNTDNSASGTTTNYMVKVTDPSLNIRTGPGTNYNVVGSITDKGTYTIVEESNGWGKLKSGAGWIKLSYTEKTNGSSGSTTPSTPSSEYKVKVTIDALRIRSGPGTNFDHVDTIRDKGTYTIVEESNGWGKLKSGAGWISLQYTRRV